MYNEVKRKANVGERIKIVNAGYADEPAVYADGDIVTVIKRESSDAIRIDRKWNDGSINALVFDDEYVVLEPIVPAAPNLPDLFTQFIRDNADAVRSYLAEIDSVDSAEEAESEEAESDEVVTQSLTRAKVIEMARERVAYLTARLTFNGEFKFRVNRERRTVVAEVYRNGVRTGKFYAKCAPDDVFNADIGKAIAAERALGLTLTDAFVNAPKPEEPLVGMVVQRKVHPKDGGVRTITKKHGASTGYWFSNGYWDFAETFDIIDDTDADYTQEAGEAA